MNITAETLLTPERPARRHLRYGPHNLRMGFREWRRSRPFWAGFLAILGGIVIMYGPLTAYKVILTAGDVVWMGILVGVIVSVFGLFLWFAPSMRQIVGVLIVLASVVSFITSDLGGFVIGMTLGMVGGSMGFSWVPVDPDSIKPHLWRRAARREWKERRRILKTGRAVATLPGAVPGTIDVTGVPVDEPVPVAPEATGDAGAEPGAAG